MRTTPAELQALTDGYNWRREREWELAAWMVAHIVQPHTKKRIKPRDLLKGITGKSQAHKAEKFKQLWERIQTKRASGEGAR